jgi:RNA recognition motif-containing protein
MSQKLYIGNLSFKTSEEEVRRYFSTFGVVNSVCLITDKITGRLRGFGFIEMEDADRALNEANGVEFLGRSLIVNKAIDKEKK